jgi:hypothetical protein
VLITETESQAPLVTAHASIACDFLVAETVTLKRLYVLVFIENGMRHNLRVAPPQPFNADGSDKPMPAPDSRILPESALPGLFQEADRASLNGQRRYVRLTGWRLILAITAAALAVPTVMLPHRINVTVLGTALAFFGAAVLEQGLLREKPDHDWYDGRAVAESAKTLSWRYAVGAEPFPVTLSAETADRQFNEQVLLLLNDAPEGSLRPTQAPAISAEMRVLRSEGFEQRRLAYLQERIIDQQAWYARKAEYNRYRARLWRWLLFTLELLGIVAALAKAFSLLDVDITGVLAAMVASGVAWLGVRQHDSLARAYTFASHELSTIRSRLERPMTEPEWAAEVRDAEEAISREHTMWRASRSSLLP